MQPMTNSSSFSVIVSRPRPTDQWRWLPAGSASSARPFRPAHRLTFSDSARRPRPRSLLYIVFIFSMVSSLPFSFHLTWFPVYLFYQTPLKISSKTGRFPSKHIASPPIPFFFYTLRHFVQNIDKTIFFNKFLEFFHTNIWKSVRNDCIMELI